MTASTNSSSQLDARIVAWLARELVRDGRARLLDAGAAIEKDIPLATVFIDLPTRGDDAHEGMALQTLLGEVTGGSPKDPRHAAAMGCLRRILVGGPGSGKSTLSVMLAQALRVSWLRAQPDAVPESLHARVALHLDAVERCLDALSLTPTAGWIPLRVNLPRFAGWSASTPQADVWSWLASEVSDCGEMISAETLRAECAAVGSLVWILDGLDEVPPSAGRIELLRTLHEATTTPGMMHGCLVTTRPQGYEGEFDKLAGLSLAPLSSELARRYADGLLGVWLGEGDALIERRGQLARAMDRPDVAALLTTPLHTTFAAVLIAENGELPNARATLFERYFDASFRRECAKPAPLPVRVEERDLLWKLHARVGLALQAEGERVGGTTARMSQRALSKTLREILWEEGITGDELQRDLDRLLRFTGERLVLLIEESAHSYCFGVRPVQEFFAAEALVMGSDEEVLARVRAIASSPYWREVLLLVVSHTVVSGTAQPAALARTAGVCAELNDGSLGGALAAAVSEGSRLAITMLAEVERYGRPWLLTPLWEVAFACADSPIQDRDARRLQSLRSYNRPELHHDLSALVSAWKGREEDRWRRMLVGHAARVLEAKESDPRIGWRLLSALLLRDHPEAIHIAEQAIGNNGDIAATCSDGHLWTLRGTRAGVWTRNLVSRFSGNHTPGRLFRQAFIFWGDRRVHDALPTAATAARRLFSTEHLSVRSHDDVGQISVAGVTSDLSLDEWRLLHDEASHLPGDVWRAWRQVAYFVLHPTLSAMCVALREVNNVSDSLELDRFEQHSPWMLAQCIRCVRDGAGPDFVDRVECGGLGSAEALLRGETRFILGKLSVLDVVLGQLATPDRPWAEFSEDLFAIPMTAFMSLRISASSPLHPRMMLSSIGLGNLPPSAAAARWIASALPSAIRRDGPPVSLPVAQALAASTCEPIVEIVRSINLLDITQNEADFRAWTALLDTWGREHRLYLHHTGLPPTSATILPRLINALCEDPARVGLWAAIELLASRIPDADLSRLAHLPLPKDPRLAASACLLQLLAAPADAAQITIAVQSLTRTEAPAYDLRARAAETLATRRDDLPRNTLILTEILRTSFAPTPEGRATHDAVLGAARTLLQHSATQITEPSTWRSLALPGIPPAAPGRLPAPHLCAIEVLTNVRGFVETPSWDETLAAPPDGGGQWIVLIGENGVGKTTLLRALALALAPPTVANQLLDPSLPLVRNGADGIVRVRLDRACFEVHIRRDERQRTETVTVEHEEGDRPWVLGYGVRRGTARGESDRDPPQGPYGELHSLFDKPTTLFHAERWLLDLDRKVSHEQRQRTRDGADGPGTFAHIWDAAVESLKSMLHVEAIEAGEEHVFVTSGALGRVRLDALSDGYLTTAGWVVDLLARWVDRQRALGEPIEPDLRAQMRGVVLVDEIDLHLHPIWQTRVIDDTRRLFPNLSFVVTTHNPLTLVGARPGEVFAMQRDGAKTLITRRDRMLGGDIDRVLLEDFGVVSTFDRDTRALLDEHRACLVEAGADDPRVRALEAELTARLGAVGERYAERSHRDAQKEPRLSEAGRRTLDRLRPRRG